MSGENGNAPGTVERAYQLAKSGTCATLGDIIVKLKQERHDSVEAHLAGPSIRRELRSLCQLTANAAQPEPPEGTQTGF